MPIIAVKIVEMLTGSRREDQKHHGEGTAVPESMSDYTGQNAAGFLQRKGKEHTEGHEG